MLRLLPLLLCLALPAQAQPIEHLEPPSWWVGMKNRRLELMVHGPGVAALTPRLHARPGVSLVGSKRLSSPNYLFIELDIAPTAKPGTLTLDFLREGKPVASHAYPLQARAPGSAQRQGFGPRDAIYLVVPDRFANGDPSNDNIAGLGDTAERSKPGGRHGGDIAGLRAKLDYIAGMGFTQVWPTPLLENRQAEYSYHGYSITNLYKIDPRFGSNADYLALTAQMRAKGLGMIQDVVPNHIGSGHWWMMDLPTPDWVNRAPPAREYADGPPGGPGRPWERPGERPDSAGPYAETNHRHVAQLDPYAAPSDLQHLTDGWFVPTMPDLNQRQPQLATYLVQNAIWWIESAGLSGLRVDTYPYSDKAFLARWSKALMAEYPRLTLVGEEMNNNPAQVAYWLAGGGSGSAMPSMMDFPLHHALREALVEPETGDFGRGWGKLYEAMSNDRLYPEPARMVLFEGNHDTNRIFSALGEDVALNKLALAFIATTRRTPHFFYGTELLMKSPIERADGEVRADFAGGWAGDAADAVTARGLSNEQKDFQAWMRQLLVWRKSAKAVHEGRLTHYNPLDGVYVYFRHGAGQKVMVVLNKKPQAASLDTRRFAEMLDAKSVGTDVLSGQRHEELGRSLTVPARAALILEVR